MGSDPYGSALHSRTLHRRIYVCEKFLHQRLFPPCVCLCAHLNYAYKVSESIKKVERLCSPWIERLLDRTKQHQCNEVFQVCCSTRQLPHVQEFVLCEKSVGIKLNFPIAQKSEKTLLAYYILVFV